jgi:hypothetical protein
VYLDKAFDVRRVFDENKDPVLIVLRGGRRHAGLQDLPDILLRDLLLQEFSDASPSENRAHCFTSKLNLY